MVVIQIVPNNAKAIANRIMNSISHKSLKKLFHSAENCKTGLTTSSTYHIPFKKEKSLKAANLMATSIFKTDVPSFCPDKTKLFQGNFFSSDKTVY